MQVLYEDNHIIIVNKAASEIVQGDKTGDIPLSELVKSYIKEKYDKLRADLKAEISVIFYTTPLDAARKALGVD